MFEKCEKCGRRRQTEAESDRGEFFCPRLGFFKKSNGRDAVHTASRPNLSGFISTQVFRQNGAGRCVHSVQHLCSRQSQGSSRLPFWQISLISSYVCSISGSI
ncbi:zinc finger domain-containing protein [Pseudoflavonifractor capillosus]|uniref:zinc finger domain-containing protein n=1 Tax=Pseudoflavonifractor capillosus TaxID=106588 RepID=UPI00195CFED0|nr:hypothetical protein [Pseudoflavonifractor capillosus]